VNRNRYISLKVYRDSSFQKLMKLVETVGSSVKQIEPEPGILRMNGGIFVSLKFYCLTIIPAFDNNPDSG